MAGVRSPGPANSSEWAIICETRRQFHDSDRTAWGTRIGKAYQVDVDVEPFTQHGKRRHNQYKIETRNQCLQEEPRERLEIV